MAFISGMASVIDLKWLQLFDAEELQIVISGTHTDIDVDDWMQYTQVVGGRLTILSFFELSSVCWLVEDFTFPRISVAEMIISPVCE